MKRWKEIQGERMKHKKLWYWVASNQRLNWKTVKNYWAFYVIKKKKNLCMYKMVDISAETWINAKVSVIKIHDNVNKKLLKLLCISDGAAKIFMNWLIKKLKETMGVKTWTSL